MLKRQFQNFWINRKCPIPLMFLQGAQHKQCGDWPSLQGVEKHFGLSETPMLFEIVYTLLYCGEVVEDFREIKKSII